MGPGYTLYAGAPRFPILKTALGVNISHLYRLLSKNNSVRTAKFLKYPKNLAFKRKELEKWIELIS